MFSFSPEFYKAALNVLIKNELFTEHIHKINEDFFSEDIEAIEHFRNIKKMINDYGYINEKIYKEEYGKKAEKLLSFNYKTTEEYVKANIKKFVYVTGIKSFMDEMADVLKEDFRDIKEEEIESKIFKLEKSAIHENKQKPLFYFENISRRILETNRIKGISTGWYNIDKRLDGGGLCPGDLGLIVGLSNKGKSIVLINLLVVAAAFGRKGLFVSLEMNEKKVSRRIDMRLMGFTKEEVENNVFDVEDRLTKFRDVTKGNIIILDLNSRPTKVSNIRNYIIDLKRSGHDIDFLVVDYADLLNSRKKYSREDIGFQEIFEDLRELANEFNMPVWTASQSNRGGYDSKLLTPKDIAGSIGKVYTVDVMITINQDEKQKEENVMEFLIVKTREGTGVGHSELLKVDLSRMIISDASDYEIFHNKKY